MKIAIGADHGGVDLKGLLAERLRSQGHEVVDVGTDGTESVDYPDYAHKLVAALDAGAERGILVCGTGQGMAMSVNKHAGHRAGVVADTFSARMIREHNDADVLCLGARVVGPGLALAIVDAFIDAEFEGGRHSRRVAKITPQPGT